VHPNEGPDAAVAPVATTRALHDHDSGVWFVTTASWSGHIIDLDRRQVSRHTGGPDAGTTVFRRDGNPMRLIAITHCVLGEPMQLIIDLGLPGVMFTNRVTTAVIAIERIKF
jgi:hypothetical protein